VTAKALLFIYLIYSCHFLFKSNTLLTNKGILLSVWPPYGTDVTYKEA